MLSTTLTKYCVLAAGDSKVALAVDTTTYSVRLLGNDCAFFSRSWVSFVIHHIQLHQNSISMIGAKRDSFPILLMGVIHLSTEERETLTWIVCPTPIYLYSSLSPFVFLVGSFSAFSLSLFIHWGWMEKNPPFLIQAGMCPPQVWLLYHIPMSLRVLCNLFSVWRTICLSGCENPRSQFYYSHLCYSHSHYWCLLSRETIMNGLECSAFTRCIFSCAHDSHTWLCQGVPAGILHPYTMCWTFSVACLLSLQLWSYLVWLNLASVDLVLNVCSFAAMTCVPVLSFSPTIFSHW